MDKNSNTNEATEIFTKVKFTDYELFRRLNDMAGELDMTVDELINIAVDKYLEDFHEHMRLWQCRKSTYLKKEFKRADNRDVF